MYIILRWVTPNLLLSLFILMCLLVGESLAQTGHSTTIQGTLKDSTGMLPLSHASVYLKKDTTVILQTSSNDKGSFTLEAKNLTGEYILQLHALGFDPYEQKLTLKKGLSQVNIGEIKLKQSRILLDAVGVISNVPIRVKGDTTIYDASSFGVSKHDDLERLLQVLPGFELDANGKIKAKGKDVSRLTVDGELFFGGDPSKATKTLRTDMIKSVELIEERTDESKESGVDDGERQSRVNIVLKEDKKRLWFGDLAASGGTEERYEGSINAMRFNGANQFAANISRNNINRSQSGMVMMGGGAIEIPMGSSVVVNGNSIVMSSGSFGGGGGVSTNTNAGLNMSRKYGKSKWLSLNGSYNYNGMDNTTMQLSNSQNPLNNELLFTQQQSERGTLSGGHQGSATIGMKLDSLTNINIRSGFGYTNSESTNSQIFATQNELQEAVNSGNQKNLTTTRSPTANVNLNVNRSLKEKKGSISLSSGFNLNSNRNRTINESLTRYLSAGVMVDSLINQDGVNENEGTGYSGNLTFVRKLTEKNNLSFNVRQSYSNRRSLNDQFTFEYNPVTGLYDLLVANMTSVFDNRNWNYGTGGGLSMSNKKISASANLELQNLGLTGLIENQLQDHTVRRSDWVLMPNMSFSYNIRQGKSLRLNLTKSASQPSVNNLQPVLNNTNPLYIREGNPDLKLSEGYNGSLSYNSWNSKTYANSMVSLSYNYSLNSHSSYSVVDPESRVQTTRPIDIGGNENLSLYSHQSYALKGTLKNIRINGGANGNYSKNTNFINDDENLVRNYSAGGNLGVAYTHKKIVASFNTNFAYSVSQNTVQSRANQSYTNLRQTLNLDYRPIEKFRLNVSANRSSFLGNANLRNQSINLMNAELNYHALKTQNLIFSLSGFDLFNQNASVQRNVGATGGINETQSNAISRYFYLRVTYRLQAAGGGGGMARVLSF